MKLKKIYLFILASLLFLSGNLSAANKNVYRRNNIQIEYVDYNGGVLLYYVDDNNKKTPVLDTVDFGNSSFIGVLVDKNYFNLKTSGGVTSKCETTENGLTVTYSILKKIEVKVAYTIPQKNVLHIDYTLKNNSTNDHTISVKSIYDTCLGEWNGTYFSTEVKQKIKSEYIITDFQKHKTLTSTDGITGIRFMMDKDYGKYAYKTVVAAKPFFETDEFDGHFIEGRGFNTVLSYNNSCVGFFFKSRALKPGKEASFSQRIEFAQAVITSFQNVEEDDEDESKKFIEPDEMKEEPVTPVNNAVVPEPLAPVTEVSKPAVPEKTVSAPVKEEVIKTESAAKTETSGKTEIPVKDEPSVNVEPENKEPVYESIKADAKPSASEKVDREKARELLERIKNLEDSGSNTDRREVIQLQAQLDELARKLKK